MKINNDVDLKHIIVEPFLILNIIWDCDMESLWTSDILGLQYSHNFSFCISISILTMTISQSHHFKTILVAILYIIHLFDFRVVRLMWLIYCGVIPWFKPYEQHFKGGSNLNGHWLFKNLLKNVRDKEIELFRKIIFIDWKYFSSEFLLNFFYFDLYFCTFSNSDSNILKNCSIT